ncbi:hypothetical protein ACHAXS_010889 [Conticribra weissflogii]
MTSSTGSNHGLSSIITRATMKRVIKRRIATTGIRVGNIVVGASKDQLSVAAKVIERNLYYSACTYGEYCDLTTLDMRMAIATTNFLRRFPHLHRIHF